MCDGYALRSIGCLLSCVALFVFGLFPIAHLYLLTSFLPLGLRPIRPHVITAEAHWPRLHFSLLSLYFSVFCSPTRSTYPRGVPARLESGRARAQHIIYTAYL
ncbi:hypothetical protein CC77DRAFT_380150 [Alternaria alternata]|uniref:Uncharacterized protein n=1 Tax=Alternaria alternata TaxID=5599 RepID=A0A177D9X4_ALTAL|nr:hypothetical protein CC77DRAFT_380150 [Alternaria alternata]OAG16515.1 hypothetical protein CC77DRAFT_380150 [Alternaria alternata]